MSAQAQGKRKFLLQPLPGSNGDDAGASPPSPSLTYPLRARAPSLSPKLTRSTASRNNGARNHGAASLRARVSSTRLDDSCSRSWFTLGCFRPPPSPSPAKKSARPSYSHQHAGSILPQSRFQRLPTLAPAFASDFGRGLLKNHVRELSVPLLWQESIFRAGPQCASSRQDSATVCRLTAQLCVASAESKQLRLLVSLQQHPLVRANDPRAAEDKTNGDATKATTNGNDAPAMSEGGLSNTKLQQENNKLMQDVLRLQKEVLICLCVCVCDARCAPTYNRCV